MFWLFLSWIGDASFGRSFWFVIQKKTSFGRQVLGGPRSAKTKHVLVNPKAFTKTCFFTTFLQCCWGCLYSKTLFKSICLTPTPTLAQHCLIIQSKMSSMFPPAVSSSLPFPISLRAPPVIPSLGNCFPCGSIN